jgi:hypothetical protein
MKPLTIIKNLYIVKQYMASMVLVKKIDMTNHTFYEQLVP